MTTHTPNFPFTAVLGQASFKLALILSAIHSGIGGVLVSGPRGLGKSTLARGLADVLPTIGETPAPFVTLPLGASEEMVVGTLNLKQVLEEKQVAFQPGLLAKAHQGVLYLDEVNLVPDQLVDLLLDVSTSGINQVERDGISHQHAARFVLLGTMNPDEGELRPQLLDRFGLFVTLENDLSIKDRVEVVKQRDAFDTDPQSFVESCEKEQAVLRARILSAKERLIDVQCSDELRLLMAQRCNEAQVDGLRADIVWLRAAMAHCAFSDRTQVEKADVLAVEELVLAHRRKPDQTMPPPSSPYQRPQQNSGSQNQADGDWGKMEPVHQNCVASELPSSMLSGEHFGLRSVPNDILFSGQKSKSNLSGSHQGNIRSNKSNEKVNWFGTLLKNAGDWPLRQLIFKKQHSARPVLNMVLLDTSASTLKNQQFGKAKMLVQHIAERGYLKREEILIMGFGNQRVSTLLSKRRSPKHLRSYLDTLPASGGTPFREMIQQAAQYQQQVLRERPDCYIRTYLLSDGRVSQRFDDLSLHGDVILVDMEDAAVKRGKGKDIADALSARYFSFPQLFVGV